MVKYSKKKPKISRKHKRERKEKKSKKHIKKRRKRHQKKHQKKQHESNLGGKIERESFTFSRFCNKTGAVFQENKIDYNWREFYYDDNDNYAIPGRIFYKKGADKETFTQGIRMGQGAGGFVYRYNNSSNNYFVALKISRKDDIDEQKLIDSIKGELGEDYPCNIVPLQKLEKESGGTHPRKNFYVMPGMDGTLSNLLDSVDEVNKGFTTALQSQDFSARLFHEIERFVRCLNRLGYVYLDLKLEQILYHCLGENTFEIYIGDLGSLVMSRIMQHLLLHSLLLIPVIIHKHMVQMIYLWVNPH